MVRVTVLAADLVAFSRTVLPLFFDELDFLLLDEEVFLPPMVIDLAAELARLRAKVVAAAVASVPRMVRLMFFFFEPLFAAVAFCDAWRDKRKRGLLAGF